MDVIEPRMFTCDIHDLFLLVKKKTIGMLYCLHFVTNNGGFNKSTQLHQLFLKKLFLVLSQLLKWKQEA